MLNKVFILDYYMIEVVHLNMINTVVIYFILGFLLLRIETTQILYKNRLRVAIIPA